MKTLQHGQRILWLSTHFMLDDQSAPTHAFDWYPPPEDYIDFGECNQVKFDLKVWLSGLGAGSTKINFERATQLELADQFEAMNSVPQNLNQGGTAAGVFSVEFGRGGYTVAADKYPRGVGRPYVYNEDVVAGHLSSVRMEIWAVGQKFLAAAGRRS